MGTDASQIQQSGLGNARPQLMYQDLAVYRNDFISKAEAVNSKAHTVSTVTDADTLVLSSVTQADAAHLLIRAADGIEYRFEIASGAGTATLDLTMGGTFFDPESNKVIARPSDLQVLLSGGEAAKSAERIDGSSIYCGCFGELKGIAGFTSSNNAGLKMEYVGPRENENAYQYRMKWYVGFDLYNRLALARMSNVLGLGQ